MDLEDRHVIRRFLDHDSPSGWILLSLVIVRATLVAEDRLDTIQIQWSARPVDQRLEDLVHLPARVEQQVAAVFDLEHGVLVMKGASLLLFQIESKTEAGGINPTLAELEQAPCNLVPRQGICDFCQVCGVGDRSKAVVLFAEVDGSFLRLTGHILVTVQHHLCPEGRVPAHLDGEVPPVRVQDMKRVMIDVGPGLFGRQLAELAGTSHLRIPNQRRSLRHQNQEEAGFHLMSREMCGRDVMLALARRTVHHGDVILFGPSSQTTTESPCHAHQMIVVEIVVGTVQRTPISFRPPTQHTFCK